METGSAFDLEQCGEPESGAPLEPLSRYRPAGDAGVFTERRAATEPDQDELPPIGHQRQLRALATQVALTGQRERRRIASGLHDEVGQALAMAKLKVGMVLSTELPASARSALEETQALLTQSIQSTRSLTFQLSSAVLHEVGLTAALQQLVEWFDSQSDDTRFVFEADAQTNDMAEAPSIILYDIARELLFNVVKYARADTANLRIERADDRIQITIVDDGDGFNTACLGDGFSAHGGFGYFSIRERLAYLNGELELKSSIGCGTRVVAKVPLAA